MVYCSGNNEISMLAHNTRKGSVGDYLIYFTEDAYIKDRLKAPLVQQQLVDIFCDGLTFDHLRVKILRERH